MYEVRIYRPTFPNPRPSLIQKVANTYEKYNTIF
jgi:hypothetical protein